MTTIIRISFRQLTFFVLIWVGLEATAQTYNDGPVSIEINIRRIQITCPHTDDTLTIGSQTGFSPDEFSFKVWARDNANLDSRGWTGGHCLQSTGNNATDQNYTVFLFTYVSDVPMYFDLKLEAWESDCGTDGYSGHSCAGSRCTYSNSCCCDAGCLQSNGDDLYCNADPFLINIDYRLGASGQVYNHNFLTGSGCSNNCYSLEVETYWEYLNGTGIGFTNSLDEETKVYPNSSSGLFILKTSLQDFHLDIFNSIGETIVTKAIIDNNEAPVEMNLQSYADGIYFVRIMSDNKSVVKKVLITH